MKIIVDGDGCAGREIIEKVAIENKIELIIYCSIDHMITSEYGTVKIVDKGFQMVDMKVANATEKNDIIVSQDYGVAAMILAKEAHAISPKGYVYTDENINSLLMQRHISQKIRKAGGKTANSKKRSSEDNERLYKNLSALVKKYNN